MRHVLRPLHKSVLVPLELIAAISAADAGIHKKHFGSVTLTLHPLYLTQQTASILSNEETDNIMEIVKSLRESGLLIKNVIKNEAKQQRNGE